MTNGRQTDGGANEVAIGTGYPQWQLAKALKNAWATQDVQAAKKVEKWQQVLEGMFSGQLQVGSRTPLADTPEWVTLEVVTGGFATGNFVAGGPLLDHETALAQRLEIAIDANTRAALNGYYLSEDGQRDLLDLLGSGRFRVDVPEEGALLVVAWLLQNGEVPTAQQLLDQLMPYFDRLRFFPDETDAAPSGGEEVFLQTAQQTAEKLRSVRPQKRLDAQHEAVEVWTPLYDRSMALLLATVDDDPPSVRSAEDGKPWRSENGTYQVAGGTPGTSIPDGWKADAESLLAEYRTAAAKHRLCRRWHRKSEPFQRFLTAIQALVAGETLSDGDVRYLRVALGRYIAKRGAPKTEKHTERRALQAKQCEGPRFHEIAALLASRIAALPQREGIRDVGAAQQPIADAEATDSVAPGTPIPPHLCRRIGRAKVATVAELIAEGYITSADVLAEVLPQITSEIRAASISDAKLRRVYAHIYRAFRRRRSLLLLNLESQVKIDELPWVQALSSQRSEGLADRDLAQTVLGDVVSMALTHFPHAILPNKLLQEIRALSAQAGLNIPLVDEVAADIFMGVFSPKFAKAAAIAGGLLSGRLYERYYGIDYTQIPTLESEPRRTANPDPKRTGLLSKLFGGTKPDDKESAQAAKTFSDLCASRAEKGSSSGFSVAANGVVIEQQQVLTTQNLATAFAALDFQEKLAPALPAMVRETFQWICRRQQLKLNEYHARLVMLKNTAYAWRQMIFYLSFLGVDEQRPLVDWMHEHLAEQSAEFRERFAPALAGLVAATKGGAVTDDGGRRFLGWTVGKHSLMPADDKPGQRA